MLVINFNVKFPKMLFHDVITTEISVRVIEKF